SYYEQSIRIHLRSFSTLRRQRSWRSRGSSLRGLDFRCRLVVLAVCAGPGKNPGSRYRALCCLRTDGAASRITKLIASAIRSLTLTSSHTFIRCHLHAPTLACAVVKSKLLL